MYRRPTEEEIDELQRGAILTYKEGEKTAALEFLGWGGTGRTGSLFCLHEGKQIMLSPTDSHLHVWDMEVEDIVEVYDYDS